MPPPKKSSKVKARPPFTLIGSCVRIGPSGDGLPAMKSRALPTAVLISLLFHLGLMLVFVLWRLQGSWQERVEEADVVFFTQVPLTAVSLPLQRPAPRRETIPALTPEKEKPRQEPQSVTPVVELPSIAPEVIDGESVIIPAIIDSLLAAADSAGVLMPRLSITDPAFFPVPIPLIPYRETRKRRMTMFPLERPRGDPGAWVDRAAEEQYRVAGRNPQPGNLLALAAEGIKALEKRLNKKGEPPPRLRKLPSREEMAALAVIYAKGEPTEHEIYAELGREIKLTADDLHLVLDGLVQQGILTQEIISPQHQFTFVTPFGSQGVELSRANLRNRVYRYHTRIDQEHMMRFLQAAHYFVGTTARADTALLRREIRTKMLQLLQNAVQP